MLHSFTTPMMKQYVEIKKNYQDCFLFFRMGDFYELFLEDAQEGARILDITLTSRAKGRDGRIPMAGVPYHAVDSYISKLVKAGHKAAICEQTSPPDKYGIVDREVIRVVTPGTMLDEKSLTLKENNYIMTLMYNTKRLGIACADISTGQFYTTEHSYERLEHILTDEITRLSPVECILTEQLYNNPELLRLLSQHKNLNIFPVPDGNTYVQNAVNILKKHFNLQSLTSFGLENKPQATAASAVLLRYLKETQKDKVHHITHVKTYSPGEYMHLDRSTVVNLELFSTLHSQEKKGSLISVLDETMTAMGGRMLRDWIRRPLTQKEDVQKRLDAVECFITQRAVQEDFRKLLKDVCDIERTLSRLASGVGNARDLVSLKVSLKQIITGKEKLSGVENQLVETVHNAISQKVNKIVALIEKNIADNPPYDLKQGGLIKKGLHDELDTLRDHVGGGKDWMVELEEKERKRTGIATLKVGFNQVFGFYIEVTKANAGLVPDNYVRKQTLVNAERYITPELKEKEEYILNAQEKSHDLEYQLFMETLTEVLSYTTVIQKAARAIAALDCITTFATIAERYRYCKPTVIESGEIRITGGRHPVVEHTLETSQFVPNDVLLDCRENQLLVITGPNMAGKSVLIRQVALITLMTQIGCFVPAEKAEISLVDRIFVRSGASDMITAGLSTFMMEMVETAQILNNATEKSLIIMDEIGRGTSTYDGISIAWAVAEHLVRHKDSAAKTLFATHYHELQQLEEKHPESIQNYHMAIDDSNGEPVFLHLFTKGGSSHSHGVSVAKRAGLPTGVITRAYEMLSELEAKGKNEGKTTQSEPQHTEPPLNQQLHLRHVETLDIIEDLLKLDIHRMSPIEALNKVAEWRDVLHRATSQRSEGLF